MARDAKHCWCGLGALAPQALWTSEPIRRGALDRAGLACAPTAGPIASPATTPTKAAPQTGAWPTVSAYTTPLDQRSRQPCGRKGPRHTIPGLLGDLRLLGTGRLARGSVSACRLPKRGRTWDALRRGYELRQAPASQRSSVERACCGVRCDREGVRSSSRSAEERRKLDHPRM